MHQLVKESGTDLWSALSWAKDDPKKGHRLSLQVYGPTIPKQYDCGYVDHKKNKS